MKKYIVKNCPCLEDIYDAEFDNDGNMRKILQQQNYCIRNEKSCDKVLNCLLKEIYNTTKNRDYLSCTEALDDIVNLLEIEETNNA